MDRISQLPLTVLHHILSFVSTEDLFFFSEEAAALEKAAARTSVLSKSWRHVWSTRPKLTVDERNFKNKQQFPRFLNDTLQSYHDQNLRIDQFCLRLFRIDFCPILDKWISMIIQDIRVEEFDLRYARISGDALLYFDRLPVVFESHHLRKLTLNGCDLNRAIDSISTLHMKNLRSLTLVHVGIGDDSFEKIISGCPLVEDLHAVSCEDLRNVRLINKAPHLKVFYFRSWSKTENTSIEIDGPAIEKVTIFSCQNWCHHQNQFRRLKSLHLNKVRLSTNWFDSFSSNIPSIESLEVYGCNGFEGIQLSSASIKRLSLSVSGNGANMVSIDVPNMVQFYFASYPLPEFFSFATTSVEWSSKLSFCIDEDPGWLIRLKNVLKALSRSKISLCISGEVPEGICDVSCFYKPVVLKDLELNVIGQSSSSALGFINSMFRISQPREVLGCSYYEKEAFEVFRRRNEFTEILCKTLRVKGENREMSDWKCHLKEAIIEASDYRQVEWRLVHGRSCLKSGASVLHDNFGHHALRFRLKWREK